MTTVKRTLAAFAVVLGIATATYAADTEVDPSNPTKEFDIAQGGTPIDPDASISISIVEDDDQTTALVVDATNGPRLVRSTSTTEEPTWLAIVEGSRIPIPRSADGTCPDVEVSDTTGDAGVPLVLPDDPSRPADRFLAANVRSEIAHQINEETCELVVTKARGYVSYDKKKIKKRPKGSIRKQFGDITASPDDPLPSPSAGQTSHEPQPAWRATTEGTIVPVTEPRHPRHSDTFFNNPCILYEFYSDIRRTLYRYSDYNPRRYGWYGWNAVKARYLDYPFPRGQRLGFTWARYQQASQANYSVSPQSFTEIDATGIGHPNVPPDGDGLDFLSTLIIIRFGGPSFSSRTRLVVDTDLTAHHSHIHSARVPKDAYGHQRYRWEWLRHRVHTIDYAYNIC